MHVCIYLFMYVGVMCMMDEYKEEILEVCGMECSSNQPLCLLKYAICYIHFYCLPHTHKHTHAHTHTYIHTYIHTRTHTYIHTHTHTHIHTHTYIHTHTHIPYLSV